MPRLDELRKTPFQRRSPRKSSTAQRHVLILALAGSISAGFVMNCALNPTKLSDQELGFSETVQSHILKRNVASIEQS
ncbi:MAG: hypothetical protein AAF066_13270 [Pseudomonadota bacterium]